MTARRHPSLARSTPTAPNATSTVAVAAHERAIALRVAGRFAPAEQACRRALAGYIAAEGARHPDVANALGRAGHDSGGARSPDARRRALLRRALAILRCDRRTIPICCACGCRPGSRSPASTARAAPTPPPIAASRPRWRRRGGGCRARDPLHRGRAQQPGRPAQGPGALRRGRRLLPPDAAACSARDRQARATLEHNLGGIEHARGRYAEAEPHARRAVALRAAALGRVAPGRGGRRRGAGGGRRGARAPRRGGGALPARPGGLPAQARRGQPGVRAGAGRPGGRRAAAREGRARPVALCARAADAGAPARTPPPRRRADRQQPRRAGTKRTSPGARGGAVPARGRQPRARARAAAPAHRPGARQSARGRRLRHGSSQRARRPADDQATDGANLCSTWSCAGGRS